MSVSPDAARRLLFQRWWPSWVFILISTSLIHWGYPLGELHFSDFHFYEKELPPLWGVSIMNPQTREVDYSFLYHNEGLMTLLYHVLHGLPLDVERKVVLVNGLNIGLQLAEAVLLVDVLRLLVGRYAVPLFLLPALLYPFSAANRYWEACMANNLTAVLFLASLALFLRIQYQPGLLAKNLVFRILPSLGLLWLSIITVEFAVCLSPLYIYLALYYSNGRRALLRFPKLVTPYTLLACLFLLTSLLPVFLFTGHRLTVAAYAARYGELAAQVQWDAALITAATVAANAGLTYLSFFFANTIGVVAYPMVEGLRHGEALMSMPPILYLLVGATLLVGMVAVRQHSRAADAADDPGDLSPDYRFLFVLGGLWMALAYFPFTLSYGYPRNVGLTADRINVLGAIGAALWLGTCLGLLRQWRGDGMCYGLLMVLGLVWMFNIQFQKAQYLEASHKERALVDAVLREDARMRGEGQAPIFLLRRTENEPSPRARLRLALASPDATGKAIGVAGFLVDRYFTRSTVSTVFHLNSIFFFWCCPSSAPRTFNFYADWRGVPRPLVYKWEEPFRLTDDEERVTLGYLQTEIWQEPSRQVHFQSYPKRDHRLVVVDIGEHTFQLGGALTYQFHSFEGERS